MIGQTISHYRIIEKLGEGGMGVVYKAEDTKLKRPVALKFLAAHLLDDDEITARFRREAEAAAALTHSNIAVIYDIDESDGRSFIVMEFVEGRNVSDTIAERPLKLDQALDLAIQTAQGLRAAHEKGVVHRDIKSANLMVTPQGQVKIMDFGLAQLAERSRLTQTTAVLGTPSYMSPEQALGEKTDRRTDLWSLGVVLYEMVTGRLPFEGERQEAVLYGITSEEPEPVTALRAGLPMDLEWIISKVLAKNRDERYQHAADLLVDLQTLKKKVGSGISATLRASQRMSGTAAARGEQQQRRKRVVLAAAAAVAGLVLGIAATLLLYGPGDSPEAVTRRWPITLPEQPKESYSPMVISPDGRQIVWAAGSPTPTLWIRDITQEAARVIPGTPGAMFPFWSPDSQTIGFGTKTELSKIPIEGGTPRRICKLQGTESFGGGTWSPDGDMIVFSSPSGKNNTDVRLFKVAALGGIPELLFEKNRQPARGFDILPSFLPARPGSRLLAFSRGDFDRGFNMLVMNLDNSEQQDLGSGYGPAYSATGHLLYMTNGGQGGLWALPFSTDTLQAVGSKLLVAREGFIPSVARDGTVVYGDFYITSRKQLVLLDRNGAKLRKIGEPQDGISYPDLSPNGQQVAVSGKTDGNLDIWIHELNRSLAADKTSSEDNDFWPTWLPSGQEIAFSSAPKSDGTNGKKKTLYIQSSDERNTAKPLLGGATNEGLITDWSSDGRFALSVRPARKGRGNDLWYLKKKDDGVYEAAPFLETRFGEGRAQFSPDHDWVVYDSTGSKQREVYLRSFPDAAGIQQVSINGGSQPRWSRDGKTIFYVEGKSLMAVPIANEAGIRLGEPVKLFDSDGLRYSPLSMSTLNYDVSADGQSFVVIEPAETKKTDIKGHVIENWFAEFKDR